MAEESGGKDCVHLKAIRVACGLLLVDGNAIPTFGATSLLWVDCREEGFPDQPGHTCSVRVGRFALPFYICAKTLPGLMRTREGGLDCGARSSGLIKGRGSPLPGARLTANEGSSPPSGVWGFVWAFGRRSARTPSAPHYLCLQLKLRSRSVSGCGLIQPQPLCQIV